MPSHRPPRSRWLFALSLLLGSVCAGSGLFALILAGHMLEALAILLALSALVLSLPTHPQR